MSFDLGVWYPHKRLSDDEAGNLYLSLCEGNTSGITPHAAVDAFYAELTAKHPEIDTIPDEKIGDHDYSPWSCALDHSPGHVIMPCVWSKAEYVHQFVHELARKHGLAVYDPQSSRITYPDDSTGEKAPDLPRWVQVPAGIFFGLVILLCLAGSAALIVSLNEKAPVAAPVLGIVLLIPCLWALEKCVRLITGRRTKGGLMGPRALRTMAWFFLLLPAAGLFTGYFRAHTVVAIVQTLAYIGIFAGLRSLAISRERATVHNKSVEPTPSR